MVTKELPDWLKGRKKPVGLVPDGLYTESHIVVDEYGNTFYVPAGPGLANLEATGHKVKIVDYKRKGADRPPIGGAQD